MDGNTTKTLQLNLACQMAVFIHGWPHVTPSELIACISFTEVQWERL